MKRKTFKIYSKVGSLLSEAMRRIYRLGDNKGLDTEFAGLGFPSEYKAGVSAGFFTPSFGKETPLCMSWYKLTPIGQNIVAQMVRKGRIPKDCHDMNNYVPFEVTLFVEE